MNNNIQLISIEGNIGSGKSTLLSNLKKYYGNDTRVIFLKEPVDEWANIKDANGVTILEKFYADQVKYSFSFQMMAYISRLKLLRDTIKEIEDKEMRIRINLADYESYGGYKFKKYIIITERSLFTDKMVFAKMLYDTGKIEDVNYQIYLNWFDTFAKDYPVHKVIYVNASPETCHKRISIRHRDGEDKIPLNYLRSCHSYHNQMLDKSKADCVCNDQLILDGNNDIYENKEILDDWLNAINNFIKN